MTPRARAEKVLREAETMHGPDLFDIERAIIDATAAAERRLYRLAEACRTRNCDKDWPALKPLIDEALGLINAPVAATISDIHVSDEDYARVVEDAKRAVREGVELRAERDRWRHNYYDVADALAAKSESPAHLASIARDLRQQIDRYKKSVALTDANTKTMMEELTHRRNQALYYGGWEERMEELTTDLAQRDQRIAEFEAALRSVAEGRHGSAKHCAVCIASDALSPAPAQPATYCAACARSEHGPCPKHPDTVEPATAAKCDHPWHRNGVLLTPCPSCGTGAAPPSPAAPALTAENTCIVHDVSSRMCSRGTKSCISLHCSDAVNSSNHPKLAAGDLTCKRCGGSGRIHPEGGGVITCGDCCGDGLR